MGQDNYEILHVDELSTDEEITASYERLKAQYNEEKWQEGEEGNEAARMLNKVEVAYREIMEERKHSERSTGSASTYDEISECLKRGDVPKAQQLLDEFDERSAEWHYLQAVVFYKKNWINESKKQLELAMQMDEENQKYKDAYSKLNARAEYKNETGGAPNVNPNPEAGGEQMGGSGCETCASMCYTFLCVNCLFNLCCGCR